MLTLTLIIHKMINANDDPNPRSDPNTNPNPDSAKLPFLHVQPGIMDVIYNMRAK